MQNGNQTGEALKKLRMLSLVALGLAIPLCQGCSGEELSSVVTKRRDANLTADGVRQILEESRSEYLAAVQEVVDDSDCVGEQDGSSCLLRVRVVQYIGGESGRPLERQKGWVYETMEMRSENRWPKRKVGRRRLVLAVPLPNRADVYGSRVLLVDPHPDDVATLRRFLELAQSPS